MPSGNHRTPTTPFGDLPDRDRIRIKLREKAIALGSISPLDKLPTVPGVHALSLALRYVEGGRIRFIEFVQLAMQNGNPHARAFLIVYADLGPGDRLKVSLDDVCAAAGVRPADLMAAVVSTAMEAAADVGNLAAASMHPGIIHAAGKSAKRIGGQFAEVAFKDRLLMLQAAKFAPVPKGASVHVHANASASAQAAAAAATEPSVPSFSDDLAALDVAKRTVQRQLTEGVSGEIATVQVTDAELVDA